MLFFAQRQELEKSEETMSCRLSRSEAANVAPGNQWLHVSHKQCTLNGHDRKLERPQTQNRNQMTVDLDVFNAYCIQSLSANPTGLEVFSSSFEHYIFHDRLHTQLSIWLLQKADALDACGARRSALETKALCFLMTFAVILTTSTEHRPAFWCLLII